MDESATGANVPNSNYESRRKASGTGAKVGAGAGAGIGIGVSVFNSPVLGTGRWIHQNKLQINRCRSHHQFVQSVNGIIFQIQKSRLLSMAIPIAVIARKVEI